LVSILAMITCLYTDGLTGVTSIHVFAQTTTPSGNVFTATTNIVVMIATAMQMLAFLIFNFLQWFLDPLFILSLNETKALQDIWKYSRDIVNVIFAFMLIFAGIYTVVTGQKELVQQKFKRFILAVILVNFSWFFPRVILDVANVLTATIYQIPAGLSQSGDIPCKDYEGIDCRVIDEVRYFKNCANPPSGFIKIGIICYSTKAWDAQTNTAYGMLNGLVINYAQLPNLTRVLNPGTTGGAGTPEDRLQETLLFLMHILFILVLMTMLFLPLAAMFVVFLIRIPIMWFTISFMPFMFIGFVIGDKMGQFDTMKIFQHYVKAAFLPTAVAVPFAVGFMILTEFMNVPCDEIVLVKAAGFCKTTGPFLTNINTLWQVLILLMAFIVIWAGFWMALKIDEVYVNATSGIKSFGESIGKTALKLPLSIPIFPGGAADGGSMSLLGLDDKLRSLTGKLSDGTPITRLGQSDSAQSK
ncbi:MAG: hypothetical protein KC680_04825, partial [Candidatus Peregrinibacteria bacterium]|nr:hypothetical protein [Candidatus Peregrinibacteria bacterium]